MRQWANKDFALSKSDPSLKKIAWGQGQGVFSRPQQPSGVEGALCPGREARRVSKPAMALSTRVLGISGSLSPVATRRLLSLPDSSVYLHVTNISFYVFSDPLSFIFLH